MTNHTDPSADTEPAHWQTETDDAGIVWCCLDKADSNANVLSGPVLHQMASLIEAWRSDPPRGLVIHSGKSNGFIMGADINEFTRIEDSDQAYELISLGQNLIGEIDALPCPSVAVINGFALGGGLELAMACRYRLALPNDKPVLGLPEVQLGLNPGFGGTVRAVRISGVRAAMQLMLTGKPITISKGLRIGLIDRVSETDDWRQGARDLINSGRPKQRAGLLDRILNLAPLRPLITGKLRAQVATKARADHYPAPYAMIDLWAKYGASGKAAYEAEARSIANLMCGSTSRNLVRVFFLQNRLKGQGNRTANRVKKVHVVGAGVMGGDIAAWCALRGLEVSLQDRAMEYVQPALDRAASLFDKKARGDAQRADAAARLAADIAGDRISTADLVIEAIFEDADAKRKLYSELQQKMHPDAILATNTSSIRLEELRTALQSPQRFIGLHFFNPVAKMPLVEIVRCDDTEQAVLDIGFDFVKAIGKFPLECASSPGFVVNRVLAPYMAEAGHLAEEGVALIDIDRAAEDFGMPMGPIELIDSVGIDVALHVSRVLGAAYQRPVPARLSEMVDNKQLGRKSGQGFYAWENGNAVKPASASPVPQDIQDRLILPMVSEAVACLHEQVVRDADLLDAGIIFGTGFAPFRGGPLNYARERGVAEVKQALTELARQHGDRFSPNPGWDTFGD